MGSTLYSDDTYSALVGGFLVSIDGETSLDAIDAFNAKVTELNEQNGTEFTLFVPGDTVNVGDSMYGDVVIGMPLHMVSAWDEGPMMFDPRTFEGRMPKLKPLTDADKEALKAVENVKVTAISDAKVHLLSWGPLCYGGVYVGKPSHQEDDATYKFVANQNMEQMWSEEGLDGVRVDGVEFSDIAEFKFDEESLKAGEAKVPEFSSPKWFLNVRYD